MCSVTTPSQPLHRSSPSKASLPQSSSTHSPSSSLAPSHLHPLMLSSSSIDPRKSIGDVGGMVGSVGDDRSSSAIGEDLLVRGFQPYRAPPELSQSSPSVTQGSLRPSLPLDLPPSYSPYHPSLYPHPLSHPYRSVSFN